MRSGASPTADSEQSAESLARGQGVDLATTLQSAGLLPIDRESLRWRPNGRRDSNPPARSGNRPKPSRAPSGAGHHDARRRGSPSGHRFGPVDRARESPSSHPSTGRSASGVL